MDFTKTIRYLKNEIHPHPDQEERDFIIDMLEKGQGYLTKRTEIEPYCRVIFFDEIKNRIT